MIVAGVSDLLDGAIARGSGQASPRGAFFDSVTDRVSDALLLGGVARVPRRYLAVRGGPRVRGRGFVDARLLRAGPGRGARLDARGGLMERAERFVFLGVALAFNIVVPVLWVMLVLTAATAVYRFVYVYRQAAHPPRLHAPRAAVAAPDDVPADPRRPAPLRTWWSSRRVEGDRTRRRHPSVRRNSRP